MATRYPSRSFESLKRQSLYGKARWKRLRASFLRDNPRCVRCSAKAQVVDHTHGHGPGWEERFHDPRCLQSLCRSCHSIKTTTEEQTSGHLGRGTGRDTAGGADRVRSKKPLHHKGVNAKSPGSLPDSKTIAVNKLLEIKELKHGS